MTLSNSVRREGDSLVVNAVGGNDYIDASGLGVTVDGYIIPDMTAMTLIGGDGNDTIIGSPFNDVIDSGFGDDTITGGLGYDTFLDTGGLDTLVETFNADMTLGNDRFIVGEIRTDNGASRFSHETPIEQSAMEQMFTLDNADLNIASKGDRYAIGAVAEDLKGIFEKAVLTGGDGNNTIVIGDRDGVVLVGNSTLTVSPWTGTVSLDNRINDENSYPEYYILNLTGAGGARVTVSDTGAGIGFDCLVLNGTNMADTVTLDAAGSGSFRTGMITFGDTAKANRDSVGFKQVTRIMVNTYGGDDAILSNDTASLTIVNMGDGDDEIVVGTVPLKPDKGNRTLEYPEGVPVADTENMSNGNSAPLFVLGEGQNDRFEVNHNRGKLWLHGGNGNDRFLLKTFLVLRENADNPDEVTNLASLFGGAGMNRYDYLQNAPVYINGGNGMDTLVVVGTPIGDIFVITDTYVAGAGRIVTYKGIESLEVDGGGGDDEIYILSTSPTLEITVDGGSGDDKIHIGGNPPPIVFDPPAYTYTPPPTYIQLPPEVVWTPMTWNLNGLRYEFGLNFWQTIVNWFSNGSVSQQMARSNLGNALEAVLNVWSRQNPYFRMSGGVSIHQAVVDALNQADINVQETQRWGWFFFAYTRVQVAVNNLLLNYEIGHLEQRSKIVQAPSITVDPPMFAFKAEANYDLSKIKGKITIKGGDAYESAGDTMIVHNQQGKAASGFTTDGFLRTPRVPQNG